MRARSLLVAAATAATMLCTTAGTAFAEEEPPVSTTATVTNVRPVVVFGFDNLVAFVRFNYKCVGTAKDNHLFVAVKQGPDVVVGSSSSDAEAYYSTNWLSDRGTNKLTCDNKTHVMRAVLLPDLQFILSNSAAKTLNTDDDAFLQICLFDSTGLTMNYSMTDVVGPANTH